MTQTGRITLHLNLTKRWYLEILSGRKTIEYRAVTPYWRKRIWEKRDRITHVQFIFGYTTRHTIIPVKKIDIGPCPYDGWDGNYYRIHLGTIQKEA